MQVAIIGAGIAGLALAKGLSEIGWHVRVYEQAEQLKPLGAGIMLTTNGLRALQALGLFDAIVAESRPIRRLSLLDEKGRTLQTTDHESLSKRFGHTSAIVLHRGDLQRVLLAHAEQSNLHTGHRCESVQQNGDSVTLKFTNGRRIEADIVLGCDGIHSAVRKALFPEPRERFAAYTCWRGITNLRRAEMDESHVTESWGRGKRFGLVALKDQQVYWFACVNAARPGDPELAKVDVRRLREIFAGFHPPVQTVLEDTPNEAVIWTDIFDITPLPFYTKGRIALLGDAAHAVTPDLGQGACQALEDVAILTVLLKKHSFEKAFSEFDRMRLARTHRLITHSRRYGRIAQWEQSAAVHLRNFVVRHIPERATERELDSILDVRFEPVRSPD